MLDNEVYGYTKEEVLQLVEDGFRSLYIRVGTDGCASVALAHVVTDRTKEPLSIEDARDILLRHGIPENYVPQRVLVRHALALYFSFEEVLTLLKVRGFPSTEMIAGFQEAIRSGLVRNTEDAYLLPDDEVDRIINS